jgi:pantothenate kinase
MDGYHFDDLLLDARGWRPRKGAPHTFDVGGLRAMLERLRANEEDEIAVPVFDRAIEIARAGARVIPRPVSIVIVEGNYLLLDRPPWTALAPSFDLTVMLHAPVEVLRARLLDRWTTIGLAGAALAAKMDGNDLPNVALVQDHSRPADHTIDATRPWWLARSARP